MLQSQEDLSTLHQNAKEKATQAFDEVSMLNEEERQEYIEKMDSKLAKWDESLDDIEGSLYTRKVLTEEYSWGFGKAL